MLRALANLKSPGILALIALCVLGGAIRLYRLGDMDTRGDEVELLMGPLSSYGPYQHFIRDCKAFKSGRILPLPRVTTGAFIKAFDLAVTRVTVRFPYALMGILTIPALWLLGIRLGDRRLSWVLAFLGTINPYNIFFSREAHVYAFVMLFVTLALAFFASVMRSMMNGNAPRKSDLVFLCLSSICACLSHMSAWPFIGLFWLGTLGIMVFKKKNVLSRKAKNGVWISFGVWTLLILPWAVVFISALFSEQESFLPGGYGPTQFSAMWKLPFVMSWGGGMPRVFVTLGLLAAGIIGAACSTRWRQVVWTVLIVGVVMFLLLSSMMWLNNNFFNMRYYTPLWVFFLLLSGLGVLLSAQKLKMSAKAENCLLMTICLIVALFTIAPIRWIVTMPGNPSPYSMVNQWMDTHLPEGAPVLVDRWFEPWNEMRYHAPSNVYVTFTIPDEPVEVFQKYQWRETSKDFFRKYPDAAYLELTKHYFELPEVGFWKWPREFFRQHVAFTNEQALVLRNAILAPKEGFYSKNTNRVVVELFYNLPEDAVEIARDAGQKVLFLYREGWGYTKLWPRVQDFRDWRVLEKQASLDIYNLMDSPQNMRVSISGVALFTDKRVCSSSGEAFSFQKQKLVRWEFPLNEVLPGRFSVKLIDPAWDKTHAPLLVERVDVIKADSLSRRSLDEGGRSE